MSVTTITATVPDQVVSLPSVDTLVFATVPDSFIQSGGSSTIISNAGALSLTATGGSTLIFDGVGGDLVNEPPVSEFVGGPDGEGSTINGSAGGSDTIFAGTNVLYNGTAVANSLFVGTNNVVTVNSAANETVFGGVGGGIYTPGADNFFFFGGGGEDTISGGAAAPTVWGNSEEELTLTGTKAAIVVAFGDGDSVNATDAAGGNTFIMVSEEIPGAVGDTFTGDTNLIGSNAGGDTFALFSVGSAAPGHMIQIQNWQPSDTFFLGGYSAADVANADTTLSSTVGGSAEIALSDGTIVLFLGNHPDAVAI
jgi:hypothetical protein